MQIPWWACVQIWNVPGPNQSPNSVGPQRSFSDEILYQHPHFVGPSISWNYCEVTGNLNPMPCCLVAFVLNQIFVWNQYRNCKIIAHKTFIIALFSAHNRQMLYLWQLYVTYMYVQLIFSNSLLQDHFKKINGTSMSLFESHLAEIVWRNHQKGNILRPHFNNIQRAFLCNRPPLGRVIPVPLFDSWNVSNQTEYEEQNSILRIDDEEEVLPCQSEESNTPSPQQIDPDTPVISPPCNCHWRPNPPVANNGRRQLSPFPIRHGVMAPQANDDIGGYESPPHHRPSSSRPVRVATSLPFPAMRQVAVLVHCAQQHGSPHTTPPASISLPVDNVTPQKSPNARGPT